VRGCADETRQEVAVPHHWFRVVPDARGPRVQEDTIKKVVRSHGGRLLYFGFDAKDRCHVLVNMSRVKDPQKLRKQLKIATGESGLVLETRAEREKRKKK
jgi:hypothetical protein